MPFSKLQNKEHRHQCSYTNVETFNHRIPTFTLSLCFIYFGYCLFAVRTINRSFKFTFHSNFSVDFSPSIVDKTISLLFIEQQSSYQIWIWNSTLLHPNYIFNRLISKEESSLTVYSKQNKAKQLNGVRQWKPLKSSVILVWMILLRSYPQKSYRNYSLF